ncbi:Lysine-specific demethylase JMJ31-like protein [Drosera capensis]
MPSTTATEESLVVRIYDEAPSPEEFSSQIEPKNVPAVFRGCVKDWRAFSRWNPSNGGLDYLLDRAGSSIVEVVLWPPSASFKLYPMPIYGEASNHSSVALDKPDLSCHPRAENAFECSQKVILHGGDALFIPEGWFHQVDSDAMTVAVNIWWRSKIMWQNQMLYGSSAPSSHVMYWNEPMVSKAGNMHMLISSNHETCVNPELDNKDFGGCNIPQNNILSAHGPQALQTLHELVAIVHDRVNVGSQPQQPTTASDGGNIEVGDLYSLDDDPIAKILWKTEPFIDGIHIKDISVETNQKFPRTLDTLITHLLSPIGAEVLTRKFNQLDEVMNEEEWRKFYQDFYSVFDHQSMAMDAILNGKESFARQVQLLPKR